MRSISIERSILLYLFCAWSTVPFRTCHLTYLVRKTYLVHGERSSHSVSSSRKLSQQATTHTSARGNQWQNRRILQSLQSVCKSGPGFVLKPRVI